MEITFSLPHVFNPKASSIDNAFALRALLDGLIQINLGFLQMHSAPALYKSGVRYGRTIVWDSIPALYAKGFGDCKSLSCAKIAEMRLHGIPCEPAFRWIKRGGNGWDKEAPNDFHILVQTGTGFIDPSKVLGMGKNENDRFFKTDGSVMTWDSGSWYDLR